MPTLAMARKKEIQIYSYDELSKEAKKRALEAAREYFAWHDTDSQNLSDFFKERLDEVGLPNDKVWWDLGYSQGSGVSFYGTVDLDEYLKKNGLVEQYGDLAEVADVRIEGENHRFRGPKSMDVEVELTTNEEDVYRAKYGKDLEERRRRSLKDWRPHEGPDPWVLASAELKRLETLTERLKAHLEDHVEDMAREFAKAGYAEIEYQGSEENLVDLIEANEWEFLEDGSRWEE